MMYVAVGVQSCCSRVNEHRQVGGCIGWNKHKIKSLQVTGGALETSTCSGRSSKQLQHRQPQATIYRLTSSHGIHRYVLTYIQTRCWLDAIVISIVRVSPPANKNLACRPRANLCHCPRCHLEYFSSHTLHLKLPIHCHLKKSANSASWPANARRRCCCDETHLSNILFLSMRALCLSAHLAAAVHCDSARPGHAVQRLRLHRCSPVSSSFGGSLLRGTVSPGRPAGAGRMEGVIAQRQPARGYSSWR